VLAGAGVFTLVWAIPAFRGAARFRRHLVQAAAREPAAVAEWTREFGDPEGLLSSYPKQVDSPAATRLAELAHAVGIVMRIPATAATPEIRGPEQIARKAALDYLTAELVKPGGPVSAPPLDVKKHLEAKAAGLRAIVSHLLEAEGLWWRSDLSLGFEAPIPNLLGQITLQRLLIAYALDRVSLGETTEAERALMASWQLNASVRHRPELISQLIAMSVARMQVGLGRRVPLDPSTWRGRFAAHDYRTSLFRAMVAESAAGKRVFVGPGEFERASRADFLDIKREVLVQLRDSEVSDRPILRAAETEEDSLSAGGIAAGIGIPNWYNAVSRADRLIFDTELTDRVLAVRLEKARLGHWPAEIGDLRASRMSDGHWICVVEPNGRLTLSFSREVKWSDATGLVLPARYEAN
jgi:hypothetical protein